MQQDRTVWEQLSSLFTWELVVYSLGAYAILLGIRYLQGGEEPAKPKRTAKYLLALLCL